MTMGSLYKEYFMEQIEADKENIENEKEMILCQLDSIVSCIAKAKKDIQNGQYELDTFCRNAQSDLVSVLIKSRNIREMKRMDSIMKTALK